MAGGKKRRALKKLLSPQGAGAPTSPVEEPEGVSPDELLALSGDTDAADDSTSASASASAPSTSPAVGAGTPSSLNSNDSPGLFSRKKKSSKQRFAERQARKQAVILESAPPSDPAWNAQLEKERQEEIATIMDACNELERELFEIQPDGHCMFAAVADQLGEMGVLKPEQANNPYHARREAARYMREHQDDFLPFLASVDGEDMPGATDDGIMTPEQFSEYCHRVESTAEWGGEPEIQALCRAFNVPIHVFQRGPPTVVSHGGDDDAFGGASDPKASAALGDRIVRISYHRRMYGLGEHYNSLRKPSPN